MSPSGDCLMSPLSQLTNVKPKRVDEPRRAPRVAIFFPTMMRRHFCQTFGAKAHLALLQFLHLGFAIRAGELLQV